LSNYVETIYIKQNEYIKQNLQTVFERAERLLSTEYEWLHRNLDVLDLDERIARKIYLKGEDEPIYPVDKKIVYDPQSLKNFNIIFGLALYLYYHCPSPIGIPSITFNQLQTILGILQVHWTYIDHPSNVYYSGSHDFSSQSQSRKRELRQNTQRRRVRESIPNMTTLVEALKWQQLSIDTQYKLISEIKKQFCGMESNRFSDDFIKRDYPNLSWVLDDDLSDDSDSDDDSFVDQLDEFEKMSITTSNPLKKKFIIKRHTNTSIDAVTSYCEISNSKKFNKIIGELFKDTLWYNTKCKKIKNLVEFDYAPTYYGLSVNYDFTSLFYISKPRLVCGSIGAKSYYKYLDERLERPFKMIHPQQKNTIFMTDTLGVLIPLVDWVHDFMHLFPRNRLGFPPNFKFEDIRRQSLISKQKLQKGESVDQEAYAGFTDYAMPHYSQLGFSNIPEFVEFPFEYLNDILTPVSKLYKLIDYLSKKYDIKILKKMLKKFLQSNQQSFKKYPFLQYHLRLESAKNTHSDAIREAFQSVFKDYITQKISTFTQQSTA